MKTFITIKCLCLLLMLWFGAETATFAQSKVLTGQKHLIMVDIPKNWLFAPNEQLPFFIKPNEKTISNNTYMYVYSLDYEASPDMYGWMNGDIDDTKQKHPGLKVDSIAIVLPNLKSNGYQTGRYKLITYTHTDHKKEGLLIIECKNTIATAVLSASNEAEFKKHFAAFKELAATIKVMAANVKYEK